MKHRFVENRIEKGDLGGQMKMTATNITNLLA